ncbi:MAG: restriction endonuclease, partial [Candidatus Omnitrophica bacterium]|nr:restriction endonuclease [Candidatus Omnitrophota bacterium]
YTYTLKQGIEDGFLAPYKVIRIGLNVDLEGWRPTQGQTDQSGQEIDDRLYNTKDFDKNLVIDDRTKLVAKKVSEYLKKTNRFDKTIIFCVDIEHANRMRQAIAIENSDLVLDDYRYVMKITGDDVEGKRELDNFISPEERYPVIATTSKLMSTGIDAQTCKLIVLDSNIQSMTEFKQIIGRGTRINEDYDKTYFTIMDFRNVTNLFADSKFDGEPVMIKTVSSDDEITPDDIYPPDEEIIDPETGKDVDFDESSGSDTAYPMSPEIVGGGAIISEPQGKVYVADVEVSVLNERVQHLDANGKLITETLKDYTRKSILQEFRTLEEFLVHWNQASKKKAVILELEEKGIIIENLKEEVKKDLDVFDLVCHIAWDQPALTRRERANNVKKRDYFTKYGDQTRKVINALLDKYASDGIENIEELSVLKVDPFNEFGTPTEIIKLFGGKEEYIRVINEIEMQLYTE